jgi:hypothetical protein
MRPSSRSFLTRSALEPFGHYRPLAEGAPLWSAVGQCQPYALGSAVVPGATSAGVLVGDTESCVADRLDDPMRRRRNCVQDIRWVVAVGS